jgi:type IV pilus assembly protein PilC
MPYFSCRFIDAQGHHERRTIYAEQRRELEQTYADGDIKLVSCRRALFRGMRAWQILGGKVSHNDFLLFNQELITLLKAGVPFINALDVIARNTKSHHLKTVLAHIGTDIRNGTRISDAFATNQIPFQRIYQASLLAGEKSGHIEAVLAKFIVYFERLNTLRRKTISSLTYPTVLFCFMIAMVMTILTVILPRFAAMYNELGNAGLPTITLFFMQVSELVRDNTVWLTVLLVALFVAVRTIERRNPSIVIIDQLLLKLPFVGRILFDNTLAVFSRTLAILISGGVTIPEASTIAIETVTNTYISNQLKELPENIRSGRLLSDILEEIPLIPRMTVEILRVGETSGNLVTVLEEHATYMESLIDMRISTLISLIEPIIVVILGLVIAFMLVSVYLPIFNLVQVIQ